MLTGGVVVCAVVAAAVDTGNGVVVTGVGAVLTMLGVAATVAAAAEVSSNAAGRDNDERLKGDICLS